MTGKILLLCRRNAVLGNRVADQILGGNVLVPSLAVVDKELGVVLDADAFLVSQLLDGGPGLVGGVGSNGLALVESNGVVTGLQGQGALDAALAVGDVDSDR